MAAIGVSPNQMSWPHDLIVVDDLIHQIAEEDDQVTLIAYPKAGTGLPNFNKFSAGKINDYVSNAAEKLILEGLIWQTGAKDPPSVIGLLGLSNFAYIIIMFALSRLGYTVLILSPRLSALAYESLFEETRCNILVSSPELSSTVDQIRQKRRLKSLSTIPIDDFAECRSIERKRDPGRRETSMGQNTAFIMHASGSTGLPKCIYLTHAACLHNFSMGYPMECLLTLPLYHMHGHSCLYRAIHQRKTCYIYDASLPLTSTGLIAALEAVQPELLLTVPYGLKLLSESHIGIAGLKHCKLVSFAGSACPDELGDHLSACGVNLVSTYGLTEAGAVLRSDRRDEPWNYLRIIPSVKPYTWMKSVGGGVYELVILDGLRPKITSNSSDPPNSYHTRDLFVTHKNIPDAWKHVGRLDDRMALVNGEKVLPLPIEGRIRQDRKVREAVVFGIGRAVPGLLAFRSNEIDHLSDGEFVNAIWPAVEDANHKAERFSQIGKDMIIPLPATRQYPQTDKGTTMRARVYEEFAPEISAMYERLENAGEGTLCLGIEDLKHWLLRKFRERLDIHLEDTDAKFFAAGVDSLQAARMLNIIRSELFLNGNNLGTSAVYDAQNVEQLALYLHNIQTGTAFGNPKDKQISEMADIIENHSKFDKHVPQGSSPETKFVFLTGATGFLGSYILAELLRTRSVARIYCPVRASSPKEARDRLLSSLPNRRSSDIDQQDLERIYAICYDSVLNLAPLLAQEPRYAQITHIIHCAWPVNFNLPLSMFKEQISSLQRLLQLSLSTRTPKPAHFIFCSSVSTASFSPSPVPEAPLASFAYAADTGYGRSKLVAEKIIQKAVESAGAKVSILRIGQIVGDTLHHGIWNDSDAVPLMVRSALAIGALPALNERCAWLPVDTVARSVVEIAGLSEEALQTDDDAAPSSSQESYVFNVVNSHFFAWTKDLLPVLQATGLPFETVDPKEWLQRLRDGDQNAEKNPSIKLLVFWAKKIETTQAAEENQSEETWMGIQTFDTAIAQRKSPALRHAPDILTEGYVPVILRAWMEKWTGSSSTV